MAIDLGRSPWERRIDVTDGVAYTRTKFVGRYRNAEERRLASNGTALTQADFFDFEVFLTLGGCGSGVVC